MSGTTIPITYTVTNRGTRATRTASWTDRIFLSQDPSLDIYDTELGTASYGQVLAAGASYTETVDVRVPDGIQGNFDIIVYADSDATTNYEVQSDIGYGLYGIQIGAANELNPYDLASSGDPQPGPRKRAAIRRRGRQDRLRRRCRSRWHRRRILQVTSISTDANAGHVCPGPDARRHLHRHQ